MGPEKTKAFLHALRHELVQPVHTLGLLVDLVPKNASAEALARWSDSAERALDNLKSMLRMLGEVAKLDLAPPLPAQQPVALGPFFSAVVSAHRAAAESRSVRLRLVASRHSVIADPDLLRLAFTALVDNAIRHGGGDVLIGAKRRGTGLLLGVWNQGAAPDPLDARYYQEDFVRGEAETEHPTGLGLGLGLGLAQRAAALLGADFLFDTIETRGARAGLVLPKA
jgi:signal transduction histidine kinase